MSTASRNCRNRVQRLQERGKIAPRSVGSRGLDPWALRPMRLQWQNNPSGKHWKPYDLGLCQSFPSGKNRRKSVDAGDRVTAGRPRPAFLRELASTQPFASYHPESGITVFNKGETMPNAH